MVFLFLSLYVFFFTKIVIFETSYTKDTSVVQGKLLSYALDGDKLSMLLKTDEKISATYYIKSAEEKNFLEENLKIGVSLTLQGKQAEILGKTIPNTFDYKNYLYQQRIYFSFTVDILTIEDKSISLFDTFKNKIENRLKKLGNNPYLRAFVLGDKASLPNAIYEAIVANGVSHLFALSGMHLSLVYFLLDKILGKWKNKKILIYFVLLAYLFLTGFSVSFLRAILFMFLLDINKKFSFSLSSIRILFLTASILLLIEPFYIYQVGFWYTFIVTFSLLFCHFLLQGKGKIKQTIFVSCITFLFSLPITIFLNYEINVMSVFNNILLVPFISTIVFPLAVFSFLFPFLLPIFLFCIRILEEINSICLHFSYFLVIGKIHIVEMFFYYILLLLGIKFRLKKCFVLLSLLLLFWYHKNIFVTTYSVYFLDVGQGDATLFISPRNREVILIDTGGKSTKEKQPFQIRNKEFDLSQNLLTFFKSIRVRKIDLLLLTHGDYDHVGYATSIIENMPVLNIMMNKGEYTSYEKQIIEKKSIISTYSAKDFVFLTYDTGLYENENDNSIVSFLQIYDTSFLLMGDVSSKVESKLIQKYTVSPTFLKVGHHGSKTSSSFAFLSKVRPIIAIISSGRNNLYHQPSKEVVKRLEEMQIETFNTQINGTIQIKIDQKGYHLFTTLS